MQTDETFITKSVAEDGQHVKPRIVAYDHAIRSFAGWIARHELWLLAASVPFLLFPNRLTPLALVLVLLTRLCRRLAWGAFTVRTPADAPLAFLFGMALAGLFTSADVLTSMDAFWRLLLGMAIYYGLANGIRDGYGLRWLTWGLVATGLGLVLLTLAGADWDVRLFRLPALYDLLPPLLRDPQDSLAFNPRVMGMALAALLPVMLSLALFGREGRVRVATGVTTLAMAVTLPLTQAVQALLGLFLAMCFLALWRSRWFLLALIFGAGLVAWTLPRYDLGPLAARLLSVQDPVGIAVVLRLDIWGRALAMLRDMPFTGIGLDSYPVIQTGFYPGFLLGPEPHSHNLFLQIALDLGLPGLVAFLGLLVAAGVMAFRAYRCHTGRAERALVIGLVAGIVSYLGTGVIDAPWTSKPGILLWVLLGSLAAVYHLAPAPIGPSRIHQDQGRRLSILAWVLPAVIFILGLLAFPGVRELNLGMLLGHKAVLSARSGGRPSQAMLASAQNHLRRAQARGNESPSLYSLLGGVQTWQERPAAALTTFERQVMLDGQNPAGRYIPYEALRRRIVGEPAPDNWQELLQVYGQWMVRYPSRAEPYVWAAIVRQRYQGNIPGAAAVLRAGLDHGAQPRGLLTYTLMQIEQGN